MATTTTIRMPDELMARVVRAAERAGTTTHGFILEAIAEKIEHEHERAGFDAEADARFAQFVKTGKTIPWSTMRDYLAQRLGRGRRSFPEVLGQMPDVGEDADFDVRKW